MEGGWEGLNFKSIKFGEETGGWYTCDVRGGYSTGLWEDIKKDWLAFSQNAVFSLGNGRKLCFWKVALC